MSPSQVVTRRVRAGRSSAKLHGSSSVGLKSAPTHVNRFGEGFIFVEVRIAAPHSPHDANHREGTSRSEKTCFNIRKKQGCTTSNPIT
jgi:hypothetical protein